MEAKHVDSVLIDDFKRFMVLSNAKWVVPASDDERRFFVLDVGIRNIKDSKFFSVIDAEMKAGGLAAMMCDLKNLPSPAWVDLRNPPKTAGLAEQVTHSLKIEEEWWNHCVQEGGFDYRDDDGDDKFEEWEEDRKTSVFKSEVVRSHSQYASRAGRRALSDSMLGTFLAKQGVTSSKATPTAGRKPMYDFPKRNEATKIELAVSDSDNVGADVGELEKWREWGVGKEARP